MRECQLLSLRVEQRGSGLFSVASPLVLGLDRWLSASPDDTVDLPRVKPSPTFDKYAAVGMNVLGELRTVLVADLPAPTRLDADMCV